MVTIKCGDKKFQDVELIGFDKDGTLLDISMYIPVMQKRAKVLVNKFNLAEESYKQLLALFGVDPESNTIIPGGNIHEPRVNNLKNVKEYLLDRSINSSIGELSQIFDDVDDKVDFTEYIKPYPGVKELLDELDKTDVKIVIFTLDGTKPATIHMKSAGIAEHFDLILGIDVDSPYHRKPAPDMLQYACKVLGVDVNKSIVIGDDNRDMLLGKNAGNLGCIGVLTGKSKEKELIDADVILSSVADIKLI